MGFPPRSRFGYKTMDVHAFTAFYQGMVMVDQSYFTDFWTKPGYLEFDPPESLKKARLQFETTIAAPLDEDAAVARGLPGVRIPGTDRGPADAAWRSALGDGNKRPVAFNLGSTPPQVGFLGGDLVIESGAAMGKRLAVLLLRGNPHGSARRNAPATPVVVPDRDRAPHSSPARAPSDRNASRCA